MINNMLEPTVSEETLDPDDWQATRVLAHQMVDEMLGYLETVRDRPLWQPVPPGTRTHFDSPVPHEGIGAEAAYAEFTSDVLPYPMGNIHPRFWSWVIGTGTPIGVMAEMLAATMNPNCGGGDHAATLVENQVLAWCKEIMGFPAEASGLLVSGGSMANLVGLTVARNSMAGYDIRREGVQAAARRLTVYGSREMHSSVQKAVELLGLGSDALRLVPVNSDFEIDVAGLTAMIVADRANGDQPICVVGNAGTVNTGAIDDLNALADLCQRENIWYHVDGAFGALARLAPSGRERLAGLERADSLAFDLHKWMYMPYEVGCTLVRREEQHRQAFSLTPAYLTHAERGIAGGAYWFSDYGVQLSRGFRALKVWLSLKTEGLDKYSRLIEQNIQQALYLARLVEAEPELELTAPVPLNIVCFRYRAGDGDRNRLNQELLLRLHESGLAAPSGTTLNGSYALRVAITNHRSRREDFDLLVREVLRIGRELRG